MITETYPGNVYITVIWSHNHTRGRGSCTGNVTQIVPKTAWIQGINGPKDVYWEVIAVTYECYL